MSQNSLQAFIAMHHGQENNIPEEKVIVHKIAPPPRLPYKNRKPGNNFKLKEKRWEKLAELFGKLAGNIQPVISLDRLPEVFGDNLKKFVEAYAVYDLDGLLVGASDKKSMFESERGEKDYVVSPKYHYLLYHGLEARLDYLKKYQTKAGETEKIIAQKLGDPFLEQKIAEINRAKEKDYAEDDIYAGRIHSVYGEVYRIYDQSWKSWAIREFHHHDQKKTKKKLKGMFYTKNFKDFSLDDHKTMELMLRILTEGFKYPAESWNELESVFYDSLIAITNWDHWKVPGFSFKLCPDKKCPYYLEQCRTSKTYIHNEDGSVEVKVTDPLSDE